MTRWILLILIGLGLARGIYINAVNEAPKVVLPW